MFRTVITGIGSYIPTDIKTNRNFLMNEFYNEDKSHIKTDPSEIVDKFQQITGIEERRYVPSNLNTSDIGTIAAREAIAESQSDIESIDQIIVAHNFGNVLKDTNQTDLLPSIAARIKHNLGIRNPKCVAYDVLFGCPGWIQGLIQAHCFMKAGVAKKCLVVGAETLSRVIDMYDRDSMIYSDGSGACVVEYKDVDEDDGGILSHTTVSHTLEEAFYLYFGVSNLPGADPNLRYLKMKGRKVYEYALSNVPSAMKECIDMAGIDIKDITKIFIHQANEKLDESIVKALYKLYGLKEIPEFIMPMNIHMLGNSSVATVPTLFDMVRKGEIEGHSIKKGDIVLFASVGGGMNINAVCYRV
jgi:3-oxoacyl-[acyl-carrier-protein] synthase-3